MIELMSLVIHIPHHWLSKPIPTICATCIAPTIYMRLTGRLRAIHGYMETGGDHQDNREGWNGDCEAGRSI